jgi:hypothetical protein
MRGAGGVMVFSRLIPATLTAEREYALKHAVSESAKLQRGLLKPWVRISVHLFRAQPLNRPKFPDRGILPQCSILLDYLIFSAD